MKNPLKLYGIDFDELFPIWVMGEIFVGGVVLFGIGGLGSIMGFVYTGLGLIALSLLIFILSNISQSIRLINEGKVIKAIIRLILIGALVLLAVYMGYNLYLSLTF